jgi:MFS transporter, DHA1 family, multidrug resistance protein
MERWKINLYALWLTQVLSLTSFGLGMPFLPFYIQEISPMSPEMVKWYTGLLNALPALTMAVMSPIWGMVSDRYGRKMMLLRAMGGGVMIIGLIGMVTAMWQIVVLRALQGIFTGTVTAALAFVASNTPTKNLSYAIGFLSSSTFLGYAIGPIIGGIVAEWFGYRVSFFVGAGLMLVAFLMVLFIINEDPNSYGQTKEKQKADLPWYKIFTPVIMVLLVILLINRVTRTVFTPYIPIYVAEVIPAGKSAAQWTGYINGLAGFSTAMAAIIISRIADRYDKRRLMFVLAAITLGLSLLVLRTSSIMSFTLLYGVMFFTLGGIEPIAMSMTAELTPADRRGTLFGFQGLLGSIGMVLSPLFGAWVSVAYGVRAILWIIPVMLIFNIIIFMIRGRYALRRSHAEEELS